MRSTRHAYDCWDSAASKAAAALVAHGNSLFMTVAGSQTSKWPIGIRVERITSMIVLIDVVSPFSLLLMQAGRHRLACWRCPKIAIRETTTVFR
jgi:hypothetical protein